MVAALILVAVLASASLLVGVFALVKIGALDEKLLVAKRQLANEVEALKSRVEALAKSVASRENPFAPTPSRPATPVTPTKPPPVQREVGREVPSKPSSMSPAAQGHRDQVVLSEPEPDVNFDCPHCGQNIDAPASMAGYHVNCPTCSGLITIPAPTEGPTASRQPQPVVGTEAGGAPEEEVLKGATVRIDISKVFEEIDRPKRQIVIKRRKT